MSETVLVRFLANGLINVGGDDVKFGKLQTAAAEIAAGLKKNPEKTPAVSLIAFDPEAPPSDPVILEALEILKKHWPTYANTFAGVPIGVLRPLLLDALVEASRENDRVAVAFVACARNVLLFMETGNEQSIWADAVREIEASVDRRAEREWATPASISVGELKLDAPGTIKVPSRSAKVDKNVLLPKIGAAAGQNPHWPNSNPQAWAQAFAARLTDAMAETIDAVTEENKVGPIDLSGPFQQFATAVSAHTNAVLNAVSGATAGLQRRTNLIWWKQSLFSASTQRSYRNFPRSTAAALMALDLYQQIPIFSPASVSAFLHEAVLSIQASDTNDTRPIRLLLKETNDSASLEPLKKEAANLYPLPVGRCTIAALIGHAEKQVGLSDKGFRDLTGVAPETQLSDADWAAWIFRDLQAGRATKEAAKKAGGKGSA